MKLAVTSPSYGPRDPLVDRHLRAAIMTASNHGITWAGEASTVRQNFVDARNVALESALLEDADGMFWMDDDIIIPPEAIVKMASYGKDFVSGLYFQKEPPYKPVAFAWTGKAFAFLMDFPKEDTFVEIDGVGFGCVYTSRKLLKAIADRYKKPFEWNDFSEDLTFCLRAKEVGMRPWLDTSIKCLHGHKVQYIGESDFRQYKETHGSHVVAA